MPSFIYSKEKLFRKELWSFCPRLESSLRFISESKRQHVGSSSSVQSIFITEETVDKLLKEIKKKAAISLPVSETNSEHQYLTTHPGTRPIPPSHLHKVQTDRTVMDPSACMEPHRDERRRGTVPVRPNGTSLEKTTGNIHGGGRLAGSAQPKPFGNFTSIWVEPCRLSKIQD